MKLLRFPFLIGCGFVLAACQIPEANFLTMSEEELYRYNAERPVMEQVVCRKEASTSTFIRKKQCQTVSQIVYGLSDSVMALDVLNYSVSPTFRSYD